MSGPISQEAIDKWQEFTHELLEINDSVRTRISEILNLICKTFGAEGEVQWWFDHGPVRNNDHDKGNPSLFGDCFLVFLGPDDILEALTPIVTNNGLGLPGRYLTMTDEEIVEELERDEEFTRATRASVAEIRRKNQEKTQAKESATQKLLNLGFTKEELAALGVQS